VSANSDRAVFLDRDGTLIEEVGYLDRKERVELYPWSIDAIRALNRAGLRTVLVTNQSGVARGFFTEQLVEEVHRYIAALLESGGAHIDAYYYCPHHPDGKVEQYAVRCDCRKPSRGLVDRAVRDLGVHPAQSFVVGDRWLDIELARVIGAGGVLVRTGYGLTEEARPHAAITADVVVDNLIAAVSWILRSASPPSPKASASSP
jgi:D-glycero-D-manno-heptose 1,7-bisphosphate phosphatase